MQQPSIGRIVHYQSYGTPKGEYDSLARAVVITEVGKGRYRCNCKGGVPLFPLLPPGVVEV